MNRYRIHGRVVHSAIALPACADDGAEPEITIRWATGPVLDEHPTWELLAARDAPHRVRVWRALERYVVDLDLVQFQIDDTLTELCVAARGTGPGDLLPTLTSGLGLSVLLALADEVILHASAVLENGAVVAFVGLPGAGKSTLAALLTATGWELFADNALRVVPSGSRTLAYRGVPELRLRAFAAPLADRLSTTTVCDTVDRRVGVTPRALSDAHAAPLTAIFRPRFTDDATVATSRRITGREALLAVLGNLRVGSWCAPAILARQTQRVGEIARSTPVFELLVPRRERVDEVVAPDLAAVVRTAVLEEPHG